MKTVSVDVGVDITLEDIANEFARRPASEQAEVLNLVARRFASWGASPSDMQRCYIADALRGGSGAEWVLGLAAFLEDKS